MKEYRENKLRKEDETKRAAIKVMLMKNKLKKKKDNPSHNATKNRNEQHQERYNQEPHASPQPNQCAQPARTQYTELPTTKTTNRTNSNKAGGESPPPQRPPNRFRWTPPSKATQPSSPDSLFTNDTHNHHEHQHQHQSNPYPDYEPGIDFLGVYRRLGINTVVHQQRPDEDHGPDDDDGEADCADANDANDTNDTNDEEQLRRHMADFGIDAAGITFAFSYRQHPPPDSDAGDGYGYPLGHAVDRTPPASHYDQHSSVTQRQYSLPVADDFASPGAGGAGGDSSRFYGGAGVSLATADWDGSLAFARAGVPQLPNKSFIRTATSTNTATTNTSNNKAQLNGRRETTPARKGKITLNDRQYVEIWNTQSNFRHTEIGPCTLTLAPHEHVALGPKEIEFVGIGSAGQENLVNGFVMFD